LGSILYLPWLWGRCPWIRYLNGCFDGDLALEFGTKSRAVLRSKLYRETFPEIEISSDQDTKSYFANTMKGERRATSTGASIIGRHAHIQVVDDPIDPESSLSELDMDKVNRWMTQTLPSRVVDKSVTPMILIMQRLAINDPSGDRLERAKQGGTPIKHICLPADIRRGQKVRPKVLKNKYKDGLLDPKRHPITVLDEFRLVKLGDYAYAGQYDQSPIPMTGGLFQVDKLIIGPLPPAAKFTAVVRWWDKAASKEKWGAHTAGILMGIMKDPQEVPRYWVLDVIRERWDTATRERMIKLTGHSDEVFYKNKYTIGMEQEPGSGGKDSALWTVRNLAGFHAVFERPSGDKMARAYAFSTQVNAGNVGLVSALWNAGYIEEMKYFAPEAKSKDRIDASSAGFNQLSKKRHKAGGFFSMKEKK
jgi:predicted phage terminase large subunit-like protein